MTHRRNTGPCQKFSLGENCSFPVLALILDNSVPPCMSLLLFKLLPLCWSSEELVQISPCMGLLRGTAWDSRSFHLSQPQSLLVFTARSFGDFSSCHWNPGLKYIVWGCDQLLFRGNSAAKLSIPIFICHTWVLDQSLCIIAPSYQTPCSFFLNFLVLGLPFSLISRNSERWLFCSLVVTLMWL